MIDQVSASNEPVGFDGKLWSLSGGGVVRTMMKVSWFLISKCWQVCVSLDFCRYSLTLSSAYAV